MGVTSTMIGRGGAWQLGLAAVGMAAAVGCGAKTSGRPQSCDDSIGCVASDATLSAVECVDMTFAKASDMSTGLVACVEAEFGAHVFASRIESCSGRGDGPVRGTVDCGDDADCSSGEVCGPEGFCHGPPECDEDSQCATGRACVCAGGYTLSGNARFGVVARNQCSPAQCRSSADCDGYACGLSISGACRDVGGFYCHTQQDECTLNSDCARGSECGYDTQRSRWRCISSSGDAVFCN